ncbi:MAG: serine--tRNA ligase [Clostridia bacterium]|nr:serine--tRNA ligase [Clostridia bacterium]
MLDINLIINETEYVQNALKKKGFDVDFAELKQNYNKRKELIGKADELKTEKNKLSASVPVVKKQGGDINEIFAKVKLLNADIEKYDAELKEVEDAIFNFISVLPNLPDDDLLPGEKENNQVIKTIGEKPVFDFKAKDHVELCESCGLIDYERAAKISGRGTWLYTGLGAQLEWALLNFFISEHIKDGYEFILPPHILNEDSGFTAGQFPKFKNDVFWLEGQGKFILPTAETALVNYHRNEIMKEEDLPHKMFAYTPCYRLEAGSYRTEERGMIRGYQFNKVEMFQYTTEKTSDAAFEELVNKAISLVEKLGLHFQVSKLAAGDCSHSMARTTDIEVWIPSMGIYKEVSSASNARDYQARRGNIRYKDKETGKIKFAHTLNASGLATSRLIPAIVEQFQNADGSITVPEVLRPFMGGLEKIMPKK